MRRILGFDPGARPGYCLTLDGHYPTWYAATEKVKILDFDTIVTEGQWLAKSSKARPDDIFTVARRQGIALGQLSLHPRRATWVIPVRIWKDAVSRDGGSVPKPVFIERLRRQLPELAREVLEREYPKTRQGDLIEAWGLVQAFLKLEAAKQLDAKWLLGPDDFA